MPSLQWNGPKSAEWTLVLAHGAGAGMDSPFMRYVAEAISKQGVRVGRFNFPYMVRAVEEGRRRPPDAMNKLLIAWEDVVRNVGTPLKAGQKLAIGGKSMGGRIASMSTHLEYVGALICLGYPFHPPGKPDKLRTTHLVDIKVPAMIIQGERDMFGNQDEVKRMNLPSQIKKVWLADGDHSFKPRKKSGRTLEQNMDLAVESLVAFLRSC